VFGRSRIGDIRWLTIRFLNAVHAPANPGFASMWYPSDGNVYLQEIGMCGSLLAELGSTSSDRRWPRWDGLSIFGEVGMRGPPEPNGINVPNLVEFGALIVAAPR